MNTELPLQDDLHLRSKSTQNPAPAHRGSRLSALPLRGHQPVNHGTEQDSLEDHTMPLIGEVVTSFVAQRRLDTPLGPVLLARGRHGLCGAWFEAQKHHPGPLMAPVVTTDPILEQAASELMAYFAGRSEHFDVPIELLGTTFQKKVWSALQDIPHGRTCTYGELAAVIHAPGAARAVGAAVGRNPLSIVVPCHRVVGMRGQLTGYAGGLERKQALLDLERKKQTIS